jgi:hypothetical protein
MSKIDQTRLGDRGVATAPMPEGDAGAGNNRSEFSTYFTKIPVMGEPTPVLYSGDRLWADVTLTLETAGPVAVGNRSQITPVLSGRGILLETGVPLTFRIAKGSKIYIAATAVNRLKMFIQPIPWQEQITGLLLRVVSGVASKLAR